MAKRFTDSEKFNDPWYLDLPVKMKLVWEYLLCACNHAGIYKINLKMMSLCIGTKISLKDIDTYFGNRVHKINNEKLFIPKFIKFQYGKLKENSSMHRSVIILLDEYNLMEVLNKNTLAPLSLGRVKDKDKEKDKEKEKEIMIHNTLQGIGSTELVFYFIGTLQPSLDLQTKWLKTNLPREIFSELEKFKNYCEANGKTYKNYSAAFSNWLKSPYREKSSKLETSYIKPAKEFAPLIPEVF